MSAIEHLSAAACPATPPPHLFATRNTNLASYYIAAVKELRFRGAELVTADDGITNVEFRFEDLHGLGRRLSHKFFAGKADPAEPRGLFDAQRFLRSEVARILRTAEVGNVQPTR